MTNRRSHEERGKEWGKPQPLAGCGPYLMTEDMVKPEKENKMSMWWDEPTMQEETDRGAERQLSGLTTRAITGWSVPDAGKDVELRMLSVPLAPSPYCMQSETASQFEYLYHGRKMVGKSSIGPYGEELTPGAAAVNKCDAKLKPHEELDAWFANLERGAPTKRCDDSPMYAHTRWPFEPQGDSFYVALARTDYLNALRMSADRAARVVALEAELFALKNVSAAEEAGNHDYHGPVVDGKAVSDPVHENFHKAVGDVLSGKVIHEARRQMQEALKNAPRDAEVKSFPTKALRLPTLEKGVRL